MVVSAFKILLTDVTFILYHVEKLVFNLLLKNNVEPNQI